MNTRSALLASALFSVTGLEASVWRATAVDAQTVILQGDYTPDERAAFRMTREELALTAWKYDRAFAEAAVRAQAHRPATEETLKKGPYAVGGEPVAAFSTWKYPIGAARFADTKNRLPRRGVKLAEVMEIVYLRLAKPLMAGKTVEIALPTGEKAALLYDPEKVPTPLIKVNQVGYAPGQGRKFAYLGLWLGPTFGPYQPREGLAFELVDEQACAVVKKGPLVCRLDDPAVAVEGGVRVPYCGEKTLEMDFSDVTSVGRYFIRVPGLGRSLSFRIDDSAIGEAFAVHMKGLFHQRCGCEKTPDLTAWTDKPCHLDVLRGVHPPNEWEYGSQFVDGEGRHAKVHHFGVIRAMTPTLTERLSLPGGWHDAADFDRRPMHLDIVNGLLALYLLHPEPFVDSQLAVPERGNGIPDVLDEAAWGIRHLRAAQQKDGGVGTWIETDGHPTPSQCILATGDTRVYCLSRATRDSSIRYAAHAALLARVFLKVGTPAAKAIADDYRASACAAWEYGRRPPATAPVEMRTSGRKRGETSSVFYREPDETDPNDLVKAAVNLYRLTKEKRYLAALEKAYEPFVRHTNKHGWKMGAERHVEFLEKTVDDPVVAKCRDFWNGKCLKEAKEMLAQVETSFPYRVPWHGPADWRVKTMGWGNCHPLRRATALCYAHALTGEQAYLDAAYLANDFHNGCNPNGTTWTTGLGVVYPASYLSIVSVGDEIDEYVPGITPYRNTFGLGWDVKKLVWNDDPRQMAWPYWRRYANVEEHSVAASEFTVWETIGPSAFTTGYLMTVGTKVPFVKRTPATMRYDLPGFWALP